MPASALGLGCSHLGSILTASSSRSARELIEFALAAGINFFDTANIYGQGDSERALGRVLRGRRDKVILVSTGGMGFSRPARAMTPIKPLLRTAARELPAMRRLVARSRESQLDQGFDRRHLTRSLEGSLRRLGTEYLDAYLLHSPPLGVITDGAVFDHLAELKRAGKILSYRASCDGVDVSPASTPRSAAPGPAARHSLAGSGHGPAPRHRGASVDPHQRRRIAPLRPGAAPDRRRAHARYS